MLASEGKQAQFQVLEGKAGPVEALVSACYFF